MIQEFVDVFMDKKPALEEMFKENHPREYVDIVRAVVTVLSGGGKYGRPDQNNIHEIDGGSYSGTIVFVVGEKDYNPSDYWYVRVSYGSCSTSDTLQLIRGYGDDPPTDEQVKDYMTLALHIVQGLRKMEGDAV